MKRQAFTPYERAAQIGEPTVQYAVALLAGLICSLELCTFGTWFEPPEYEGGPGEGIGMLVLFVFASIIVVPLSIAWTLQKRTRSGSRKQLWLQSLTQILTTALSYKLLVVSMNSRVLALRLIGCTTSCAIILLALSPIRFGRSRPLAGLPAMRREQP